MAELSVEICTIPPYVLPMEDRVGRLEGDVRDVKSLLSRLEPMIIRIDASLTATLPHLATRAEVTAMQSGVNRDIAGLRIDVHQKLSDMNLKLWEMNLKLSDMPNRIYMWGVLGVLITAYGAGLAALAVLK